MVLAGIVGARVVVAMVEVLTFSFLGRVVNWISTEERTMFWATHGVELGFMVLVIALGLAATWIATLLLFQSMHGNFPMYLRWYLHRHLLGQSLSFFNDDFSGRISNKVMQTALSTRDLILNVANVIVYACTYVAASVVILSMTNMRLIWPLLIWLITYIGLLSYFIPRLARVSESQSDARSVMTGQVVDAYTNIATVKLFSHAQREEKYVRKSMRTFLDAVYLQGRLVSLQTICFSTLNNLFLHISYGALVLYLWQSNAVTAGDGALALSLILRLGTMSYWIFWVMAEIFESVGVVSDGLSTLSKPLSVVDKVDAKPITVSKGLIEFENVSFHYGKDSGVIDDFSLNIRPGEKVALVGRSGAGKSTLVNLLLRFYDAGKGLIKIDDQNISEYQQDSLRQAIGMVTQDTSLLHRTIRENILYGRPEATEAQMRAAISKAQAHEFVSELVDQNGHRGLDALVGERGVKLSGGQRQRIAIARVLLKDAPILVLDEATSALDSEVEAVIQQQLYELMQGKTVLAIAHRLSTIAAMDRLVVLDKGRIVEQGTHRSLLQNNGLYAQLWARQSGGMLATELNRDSPNGAHHVSE